MLGAIQILKQDLKLFGNNWKKIMPFLWLLFIPTIILSLIGILMGFLVTSIPKIAVVIGILVLIIVVATLLFTFWVSLALTRYLYDLYNNNPTKIYKEYLSLTSPTVLPVIIISILTSLIIFGGLILLIIPGVIFTLWYIFANYVRVMDHKTKVIECLKESKRLVSGRWWAIFWRFFLPGLILGLSIMIVNFLLSLILGAGLESWPVIMTLIISVATTVVGVIATPLSAGLGIIIYSEARKTKPENSSETSTIEPKNLEI